MIRNLTLTAATLVIMPLVAYAAAPAKPAAKTAATPAAAKTAPATAPDLSGCKALRDPNAYGKKYDSYKYLVQGKNGWLFRSEADFRTEFKLSNKIDIFKQLSAELKKRGTDLVIAYIPLRGMTSQAILPANDPLLKGYNVATARKAYADYIMNVRKAGIHIVGTPDLKSGEKYFYKADQHWSTTGAREMAATVGAYVKALPSFKGIRKATFETKIVSEKPFDGTFNEATEGLCNTRMPDEQAIQTVTNMKGGGDSLSLFGKSAAPSVVLVGTSNSKKDQNDANFEGSLKEALGTDVYNAAITGGGLDDSIIAYLSSEEYKKNPPKILIWEFPGYYNLEGDQARKTLRQVIPILYGECKTPLAASGPVKVASEQADVMKGLTAKNINSENSYLWLKFAEPVKKNFSVSVSNSKPTKQSTRFSRSRLYPYSGSYFFAPKGKMVIDTVSVKVPKEMVGFTVNTKLCAVPKA